MNTTDSLGQQLRQQRQTLTRHDVGLPVGDGSRHIGLTLAEVAVLSGVGSRWLGRLEQDQQPLRQFDALKRVLGVLQFGRKEQATLLKLAGWEPESLAELPQKQRRRLLQQAVDAVRQPAYVLDHLWNPVCHNTAATQLFSHWLGERARHNNLLDYLLLDPHSRAFIGDWHTQAPQIVLHFMQHIEPYRDNDSVAAFLQARQQQSPLFARHAGLRDRKPVLARPVRMTFRANGKNPRNYQRMVFQVEDTPDWQWVLWLPEKE